MDFSQVERNILYDVRLDADAKEGFIAAFRDCLPDDDRRLPVMKEFIDISQFILSSRRAHYYEESDPVRKVRKIHVCFMPVSYRNSGDPFYNLFITFQTMDLSIWCARGNMVATDVIDMAVLGDILEKMTESCSTMSQKKFSGGIFSNMCLDDEGMKFSDINRRIKMSAAIISEGWASYVKTLLSKYYSNKQGVNLCPESELKCKGIGNKFYRVERKYLGPIMKQMAELFFVGFGRLVSNLREDIRKMLYSNGDQSLRVYRYFIAENHESKALYRHQAIRDYPILFRPLIQRIRCGNTFWFSRRYRWDDLLEAIDAGVSVVDTVAKIMGVKRATIRHLYRVPWQRLPSVYLRDVDALIQDIDKIDHGILLALKKRRHYELIKTAVAIGGKGSHRVIGDSSGVERTPLIQKQSLRALEKKKNIVDYSDFVRDMHDFYCDAFMVVIDSLEDEYSYRERIELSETVYDRIFGGMSVDKVIELIDRWHDLMIDHHSRFMAEKNKGSKMLSWEPLLDRAFQMSGYYIHALGDEAELGIEGLQLKHCVGGYGEECCYGGAQILSIRNDAGRPLSTIQYRYSNVATKKGSAKGKFDLIQHYGFKNKHPSKKERSIASNLLIELNAALANKWQSDRLPLNPKVIDYLEATRKVEPINVAFEGGNRLEQMYQVLGEDAFNDLGTIIPRKRRIKDFRARVTREIMGANLIGKDERETVGLLL